MIGHRQRPPAGPASNTRNAQRLRRNAVMGVHALSLALMCVAVACPNWGETDTGSSYGLWKVCISLPSGTDCYNIDKDVPNSLTISRAFLCLSLAVAVLGVTMAYIVLVKELLPAYSRIILAGVLLLTGVCAIVGVGIMGGDYMGDDKTQWCLPLAVVAAVLFLANGLSVPKVISASHHGSVTKVAPRQQVQAMPMYNTQQHQPQPPAYAETNPDYQTYNQGYDYNQGGYTQSQGHGYGQPAQQGYPPEQQHYSGGGAPHHGYMDEPPPAYT